MIKFKATLPPIKSAILLDGQGDGGQVKLEVPRSDVLALIALQTMAGKVLTVTVKEDEEETGAKKSGRSNSQFRQQIELEND